MCLRARPQPIELSRRKGLTAPSMRMRHSVATVAQSWLKGNFQKPFSTNSFVNLTKRSLSRLARERFFRETPAARWTAAHASRLRPCSLVANTVAVGLFLIVSTPVPPAIGAS